MWSETDGVGPADQCTVSLVELPRLRLSFRAVQESDACLRLDCVEHAGLRITTRSDERTRGLLRGLQHSLLLENGQGELFVLVSATTLPTRARRRAPNPHAATRGPPAATGRCEPCCRLTRGTLCLTGPALNAAIFSTEVVLDRANSEWLSNVGNAPAYIYPVHVGRLSLSWPTFAAGVYLLLLRFLARQYQ